MTGPEHPADQQPGRSAAPDRPEIVCLCGSARFVTELRAAHRDLTLAGVIVLAPGEAGETVTDAQKTVLDALHLRKIDLADRVLVVDPGGYVGESTRREIAYARATGTPVSFTDEPGSSAADPGTSPAPARSEDTPRPPGRLTSP